MMEPNILRRADSSRPDWGEGWGLSVEVEGRETFCKDQNKKKVFSRSKI